MSSLNNPITCTECKITFTLRKNLYAHMRKIHHLKDENDPVPKRLGNEVCNICSDRFTNKSSLKRHLRVKHAQEVITASRQRRIKCPLCCERVRAHSNLREHLTNNHEQVLLIEEHKFHSEEEFQQWKNKTQLESLSNYVMDTTSKQLSEHVTRRYYNCHRSHDHKPGGNNIRAPKAVVSNKIGAVCPARIELTIQEGAYVVRYWKTHVGHSNEVNRMFLSKETRTEIADKLKQGATFDEILDEFRNSQATKSERVLLLKKKDLHNIVRDFNLQGNFDKKIDIKEGCIVSNISSQIEILKGEVSQSISISCDTSHNDSNSSTDVRDTIDPKTSVCDSIKNKVKIIVGLSQHVDQLDVLEQNLLAKLLDEIINLMSMDSTSQVIETSTHQEIEKNTLI